MLSHLLKSAFRSFKSNLFFSAVNILSLSLAISSSLIIFSLIQFETSFNKSLPSFGNIYRIYANRNGDDERAFSAAPTAAYKFIKDKFAGIQRISRINTFQASVTIPGKNNKRVEFGKNDKIAFVEREYFDLIRNYVWLAGNERTAMEAPYGVVLTAEGASQYFGFQNFEQVLGRELVYQDSLLVTVTGIVSRINKSTDFHFTDFISFKTIESSWIKRYFSDENWGVVNTNSQLFVELSAGFKKGGIENQLDKLPEVLAENKIKLHYNLRLQPLSDLHFNSELEIFDRSPAPTNKSNLYYLIAITLLISFIVISNYANLAVSKFSTRAEMAVIKRIYGASRVILFSQVFIEGLLVSFISAIFSVVLIKMSLFYFDSFLPSRYLESLLSWEFVPYGVLIILLHFFLSIVYPAFMYAYSRSRLTESNQLTSWKGGLGFRKAVLVFQFLITQLLIFLTIGVSQQLDFVNRKDLGFEKNNIIYFDLPWWLPTDDRIALRNKLAEIPEIERISLARPPIVGGLYTSMRVAANGQIQQHNSVKHLQVDSSYLHLFGMNVIAGRLFEPNTRDSECIINENFMQMLGFHNPDSVLGLRLENKIAIVGVVRDFNTKSLHSPIEPVIMYDAQSYSVSVKFRSPSNEPTIDSEVLSKIKKIWAKIYPDELLEIKVLSETIEKQYEADIGAAKLLRISTLIAIGLSSFGLFALSSLVVMKRTKEIVIRKIVGANGLSITGMLLSEFAILVIISSFFWMPLAFVLIKNWLQEFAFKFEIGFELYLSTLLISLFLMVVPMIFWILKVIQIKPVKFITRN